MKRCSRCGQVKSTDAFTKRARTSDGLELFCRICKKASRDPEAERQARRRYYREHLDVEQAKVRKWQEENREAVREACRNWRAANPQHQKAAGQRWRQQNPHRNAALASKRHASKKRRTPPWLTDEHFEHIRWFYWAAEQLSLTTGVPHQVDHIVPLQGDNVSGLHVPWNLQVLTASQNSRKGNRFNDPL